LLSATDADTSRRRDALLFPMIWDLATQRHYASLFVEHAATAIPKAAAPLRVAQGLFRGIHGAVWEINRLGGGQDPGSPLPKLADAALRLQVAQMVLRCRDRDLEAAILGLDDAAAEIPPAEGQWPVKQAYAHLAQSDIGFYVLVSYALGRHRAGDWKLEQIPDPYWDQTIGLSDEEFGQIMHGPLSGLKEFHRKWHEKVIAEFQGINEAEIELPSLYWEAEPMTLRFRLHRFDSHLRQHTIQIDKTLVAIGRPLTEAQRLVRLIYAALAESESQLIGAESNAAPLIQQTADSISNRAAEIQSILQV
jgi:hypothetical protein